MANISFMLTTEQIRRGTKDVTRRLGWESLRPGTLLTACVKCMGLKAGEQVQRIREIRIVSVRREPLQSMVDDPPYGQHEAIREGFPELTGAQFVEMFCREMKCRPETIVTRIEFSYDINNAEKFLF